MRKIVCPNYKDACSAAAEIIEDQLMQKPDSVFGLATGGTSLGVYEELIWQSRSGGVDFSRAKAFNLDEYYPIKADHPQSYRTYMQENLFSKLPFASTDIPNGEAHDPSAECVRYDAAIEAAGGIDLQLLGIGLNGHIGFNEPSDAYTLGSHIVKLTESTIRANSRFFTEDEEQPTQAITIGIDTIFKAQHILLLITGAVKAKIARKLFDGKLYTDVPACFLQLHRNVTVIMDETANS